MKTYRKHNCQRRHRTTNTLAKCMFPRAAWVHGKGEYASLAWCRELTVELHSSEESANTAKSTIDALACGGFCTRNHEVVRLEL